MTYWYCFLRFCHQIWRNLHLDFKHCGYSYRLANQSKWHILCECGKWFSPPPVTYIKPKDPP